MTKRVDSTHTHTPNRAAFTLIELLVVISIIGLLSTIAITSLGSSQIAARNARRRADMIQITKALELYYNDFGAYPSSVGCPVGGYCGSCGTYGSKPNVDTLNASPSSCLDLSAPSWIPGLTSCGYMSKLPSDPNSGKVNLGSPNSTCRTDPTHNCYIYRSDGINYAVFAYCTPEGTWTSSDLFYSPGGASNLEWKLTNNPTATANWF